ncbi:MAG: DNA polymerase Y family protein [Rhodobacteraceae bacterium]|nr:DNA polymerase Y family protein [Paracoccaceae bacterium]
MRRRVLCVWFPRLASDLALRRKPCRDPFALVQSIGNAGHLHCLNAAAERAGLARGMTVTDARMLCPGLRTAAADLAAERRGLGHLVRWAGRYGPKAGRDGSDGLVADISGVAHLFGGEEALLADLSRRLAGMGLLARAGIADTRGAAYALSRGSGAIAPAGATAEALAGLPPQVLRIDHATVQTLGRLGITTIGELESLPRPALSRRFGPGVLLRLDQAFGRVAEPVVPDAPEPVFAVRLSLPEPIGLAADVLAGTERLLDRLCGSLRQAGFAARTLVLTLRRVDQASVAVELRLARPMADASRMLPLFRRGVEEADAGFGIDQLRIEATAIEPAPPEQTGRFRSDASLEDLVTRLGARLGLEAIERLQPVDTHSPERSFVRVPFAWSTPARDWPARPDRPLVLYPPEIIGHEGSAPPARFRWRRMHFTTGRATGPERIAPSWWEDDPGWGRGTRDYWKVETLEGRRLWLFHTPRDPAWFVQGEFA